MPRTQRERSEATVAGLLDACIETIIEVGYARTSAALITKRAHVSDGALFRHFPTMRDLMAATLREAGRRQLELYTTRIAQIPAERQGPEAVLLILRDITHNRTNGVIYELLVAARTDEKLRALLRDEIDAYQQKIFDAAKSVPTDDLDSSDVEGFGALVTLLLNAFDGAAIFQGVLSHSDAIERRRITMLASLLSTARPGRGQ
ncbi:helix-turn-helix domain-containing protein [Mycobacterium sp. NPDC049093]